MSYLVLLLRGAKLMSLKTFLSAKLRFFFYQPKSKIYDAIKLLLAVAKAFMTTMDEELGDLFGSKQKKAWTMLFAAHRRLRMA